MIRLPSIRSKLLAVFVVAGVLPLAAISLIAYYNSLRSVEEMVGNRTSRLATSVGTELGRKFDRRVDDRILQANQPVQDYLQSAARHDKLARLKATEALQLYLPSLFEQYGSFYDEMILADAGGEPLFKFHRSEGAADLAEGRAIVIDSHLAAHEAETAEVEAPAAADEVEALLFDPDDHVARATARSLESVREMLRQQKELAARLREVRPDPAIPGIDMTYTREALRALRDSLKVRGRDLDRASRAAAELDRGLHNMKIVVDPFRVMVSPDFPAPPLIWPRSPMFAPQYFSAEDRKAARTGAKLGAGEHRMHLLPRGPGQPPTVCLVEPIYAEADSARRLGTLMTKLRGDYVFPEDYGSRGFGESGDLAVVDVESGQILFHTRGDRVGKNFRLVDPALGLAVDSPGKPAPAASRRAHGSSDASGSAGRIGPPRPAWARIPGEAGARLASVFDVPGTTWRVVATARPGEFGREAGRAGLLNLLVSSVAIILAGAVLVVASGRISRSIGTVTAGARRIADGDLEGSIQVQTHDEIQTLAETFNTMTISLRDNIQLRERVAAELDALNRTLEQRVQDRTRELRSLNEALNQANQELKELDRLKTNFLATVSHEFKTPLTSIKAFAEILLDEAEESPGSEVTRRFLKIINSESDRLGRLIKHLLDLSRIESNRMAWRMSVFPVHQAVDAALEGLLPAFSEKKIVLERDLRCGHARVNADQDRIQEVLCNILDNAIKVSPPGGRILVACRGEDGSEDGLPWVRISVQDEGDGIPPDQLDRIFDRFTQVESARAGIKGGTGLGLAISREIVEHHGGRIWAENAPGRGAAFHFTLPTAPRTEDPGEARHG